MSKARQIVSHPAFKPVLAAYLVGAGSGSFGLQIAGVIVPGAAEAAAKLEAVMCGNVLGKQVIFYTDQLMQCATSLSACEAVNGR